MPLTTCAAIRAGSAPRVPLNTLPSAYVKVGKAVFGHYHYQRRRAAHYDVRAYPGLLEALRALKAYARPQKQAASILTRKSRFCIIEN